MKAEKAEHETKKATIYDVARLAGVSIGLVSRTLNDPENVGEKRRAAVLAAIKQLDYRPSKLAQNLAGGRTRTIGVIVAEFDNLSYINILAGMRQVFDKENYQITLNDLHKSGKTFDPVLSFSAMHVEALVFIAEPENLNIKSLNLPSIMIGERGTRLANSEIFATDDIFGSELAMQHLYDLGHKKIIHITGAGAMAKIRVKGYQNFMEAHSLAPVVVGGDQPTTPKGGYDITKNLLDSGQKFSALFCVNDSVAAGAVSALREANLRVPEDVSIVGYDNSLVAADFMLKLTTVDDQAFEIGVRAAERIIAILDNGSVPRTRITRLKPKLIVRNSAIRR